MKFTVYRANVVLEPKMFMTEERIAHHKAYVAVSVGNYQSHQSLHMRREGTLQPKRAILLKVNSVPKTRARSTFSRKAASDGVLAVQDVTSIGGSVRLPERNAQ